MNKKKIMLPISTLFLSAVIIFLIFVIITFGIIKLVKSTPKKQISKDVVVVSPVVSTRNCHRLCNVCRLNGFSNCKGVYGCDCKEVLFNSWIRNRKDINYHFHYPKYHKKSLNVAKFDSLNQDS